MPTDMFNKCMYMYREVFLVGKHFSVGSSLFMNYVCKNRMVKDVV